MLKSDNAGFCWKTKLLQKGLKMRLVIIFCLYLIYNKVYIISYVPVQVPYYKKSASWGMGRSALSQSDCKILNQLYL